MQSIFQGRRWMWQTMFRGLKSAVLNYLNACEMKGIEVNKADVAASFQKAVVDVLVEHSLSAVKEYGFDKFAIAGGVASNSALRTAFETECQKQKIAFYHPSPIFCTDNAAMIGVAGYYDNIKDLMQLQISDWVSDKIDD